MKIIRIVSRITIGLVFLFSGFVKGIDPLGSTYKFQDYFEAFHLEIFHDFALPLAIILSTFELVIGLNMLAGIRMKITSWFLMLFMAFFTLLTLYLAISNPVSDCGCFGDAIKLTNWQTFFKNIIFLVPALIVFFQRNQYGESYGAGSGWVLSALFLVLGMLLSVYCYRNLPVIDFLPYSTGTHISDRMIIPEGMPNDEYETVLVYQKDGVPKEFTTENYPWQDTAWKWVETRQKLIRKGYEPPIHDFVISTEEGFDMTEEILNDPSYIFLVIARDLDKATPEIFENFSWLAAKQADSGTKLMLITSSPQDQINAFRNTFKPVYPIFTADEITLKTMIRANPGILLLKGGTILGKWHYNNFKAEEYIHKNITPVILDQYRRSSEKQRTFIIATGFLLVLSIFHIITRRPSYSIK
jgi:uncharacterized membrane protein YphA (DoxX/SURF4 family)